MFILFTPCEALRMIDTILRPKRFKFFWLSHLGRREKAHKKLPEKAVYKGLMQYRCGQSQWWETLEDMEGKHNQNKTT